MSIQNNFPAIRPSLNLDFANTKELDPRITFTRASTASYYGTQTAKAEENLLLQSQTFDNASWLKTNATTTANSTTAPDGTTTAETITDDATNSSHRITQIVTTISSTYTFSVFLKKGTNNFAQVCFRDSSAIQRFLSIVCDLDAGTITQTNNGASATLSASSIASVGNGWYRVVATGFLAAGTFAQSFIGISDSGTPSLDTGGLISYAGTGTTIYAWGAQLEQRSAVTAYTPTTTQAITNYIPVLETAASGVARFDHNPTTFESLGFLVEEQRTNLFTYSEQFDNAAWVKTNATITANTVVSPDGTLDADKLIFDASSIEGSAFVRQTISSFTSGVTYTATCFFKAAERTFAQMRIAGSQAVVTRAYFDLVLGTVAASANCTATILSVGNGWFRCAITFATQNTGSIESRLLGNNSSSDSGSNTGDGYSGIYIWGAQLEAGAFPTSYIPTVASQVTRADDAASMTGTNFSSWYRADEGTIYSESVINRAPTLPHQIISISDATNFNNIDIRYRATGNIGGVILTNNTTYYNNTTAPAVFANQISKDAFAFAVNDCAESLNGGGVFSDASVVLPVVSVMNLGASGAGFTNLNAHIRKIAYYPKRLSNTELQGLTS